MATSAKMSFNYYQNGKYGTLPQNPSKDMEVTQDMHLKMSKKIAQLTKVIYALNTKNDEHEAVLAGLKEQHEDEMQQLLGETREKIDLYKSKIGGEVEYRHRIETLEACVAQYDKQRHDAFAQFEAFKKHAEERESLLKTGHSEKMLSLSQEVLAIKKDFEDQLAKFAELREQMENDKLRSLEELRIQHLQDIERVKLNYQSQSSDFESDRAKLEQLHRGEIERLEEQCELVKSEKSKVIEDYEGKLCKAQAFYENELAVIKNSQNSGFESELCSMREQQEKLRKDFAFQESQYKQRIDSLIEQLSKSEEDACSYKNKLDQLQMAVDSSDSSASELRKQLEAAREEAASAMTRLREHQAELVASKQMCDQQAQDLLRKSTLIGELEATRLQHESIIGELQSEVNKLRDKLSWLEGERNDIESKKMTEAERADSQLRSLEKALEDISIEKQTMKEKYEREIKGLNEKINNREKSLQSDHSGVLEQLKKQHQEELQLQKQTALEHLAEIKQGLEKKLEEETERLTREKEAIQSEFERMKAELLSKLQSAEEEVRRLEQTVKESENGLGSASTHINNLKDASTRLKQELDNSRGELKVAKTVTANLQAELEKTKMVYETKLTAAERELKTRTQQLTLDLEKKWTDTLRKETTKLHQELSQQKDDEMRAALQQLTKMKDDEMAAARFSWEARVNDLLNQISTLSQKVASAESSASTGMETLRREMEAEKLKLEQRLQAAEEEYVNKIGSMESDWREQLRILGEQKDKEAAEMEASLKYRHLEELQGQITAHKAALDATQQEAEKARITQLGELKARHKQEIDTVREDLGAAHSTEMTRQAESHQSQIHAARLELERSIEITKQKERDHLSQTEELRNEISQRERHIKNLDEEISKLRRQLEYLSREIESKGREISKVKSDADINLKKLQEALKEQHSSILNNLAADHLRETQDMLIEFNNAQELLKDKISELNIMLDEAEERYRDRDSRPEDLELIQQLREAVSEREGRMKQLLDEKRYYQMELVNRETNFNKVFNSTPNVGIMNPLAKPKKKGDRAPGKFTSAPSLNAWGSSNRLDPLPNSPLHDEKLNPAKPLPQPHFAKKFVK